ncbi:MAG: hypothetical protein GY757_41015, partial [bacterium]|nr:hypothetical protein [bacterium]
TGIAQLYTTTIDMQAGNTFQQEAKYQPETLPESGMYRLKLNIQREDGGEQNHYRYFTYKGTDVTLTLNLPTIEKDTLVPNRSYTIGVSFKNSGSLKVNQGNYALIFRDTGGQELLRKEYQGLELEPDAVKSMSHEITFIPGTPPNGDCRIVLEYLDETMTIPRSIASPKLYRMRYSMELAADKDVYYHMDTAKPVLKINGIGSFNVRVECPQTGLNETMEVVIPDGSPAV